MDQDCTDTDNLLPHTDYQDFLPTDTETDYRCHLTSVIHLWLDPILYLDNKAGRMDSKMIALDPFQG